MAEHPPIENDSFCGAYHPAAMQLSAPFTRALLSGFDHAYPDLLRIATLATGSRDEARELVHDTWLRLAEHQHGATPSAQPDGPLDAPRDVTAYLAVMAQHLAVDAQRRRQRHLQFAGGALVQEQIAPSHTPDVADAVMYRQALAMLEATLTGLPERARSAFIAHRVNGESQPDIAERLGVSLNTVERDLMVAAACIEDALMRWRGSIGARAGATRTGRRRSLGALLGLAGLGCTGVTGWWQWQVWEAGHVQWQAQWRNPRGQHARHGLPDGSMLHLDAGSEVQVAYYAGRRTVRMLRGAAFFEVVRDESRPFTVEAAGAQVTVLGTRFSVDWVDAAAPVPTLVVQVEEGRVKVQPANGAPRELGAGEGLRLHGDAVQPLSGTPTGAVAPWRQGELVFSGEPLGDALARLSRYAPFALQTTPAAAALLVSGRVRIVRANAWLQSLPHALPVRVQPLAEGGWRIERVS